LAGAGNFSHCHHVQISSGTHPASYTVSIGVRQTGCEADQSPVSSAEGKSVWSYTSTPPVCLHGMVFS